MVVYVMIIGGGYIFGIWSEGKMILGNWKLVFKNAEISNFKLYRYTV